MITSDIQATQVQRRHFEMNKKGYAKAVVRYFKQSYPKDYQKLLKLLQVSK